MSTEEQHATFRFKNTAHLWMALLVLGVFVLVPAVAESDATSDGVNRTPQKTNIRLDPLAHPNLCEHAELIIVGGLSSKAKSQMIQRRMGGTMVVTDVQFAVSHVLLGDIRAGDEITLRLPGGKIGTTVYGSTAAPDLQFGQTYVLFLSVRPLQVWPAILAYRSIPSSISDQIPDDTTLQRLWRDGCAANPDGVYFGDGAPARVPAGLTVDDLNTLAKMLGKRFEIQSAGGED